MTRPLLSKLRSGRGFSGGTDAKLLDWEGQIGALKPGYLADIIAVPGNPLDDISTLQHVDFVMKAGEVYKTLTSSH